MTVFEGILQLGLSAEKEYLIIITNTNKFLEMKACHGTIMAVNAGQVEPFNAFTPRTVWLMTGNGGAQGRGDRSTRYSLALEVVMYLLKMVLDALPEKRRELEQAVTGMLSGIRNMPGCQQCQLSRDIETISRISVISHWANRENLNEFLLSDRFAALMGTTILLQQEPLVYLYEVVTSEGLEAIHRLRSTRPKS